MSRAVLAALLLFPVLAFADPAPEDVQAKIAAYEKKLAEHPGFDWSIHNELRHLYIGVDAERSMHHSDEILKHSVMDDYILRILSGWQLGKDEFRARENLREQLDLGDFKFVEAACMIKLGDLAVDRTDFPEARFYYMTVQANLTPDLAAYRALADVRLKQLKPVKKGIRWDLLFALIPTIVAGVLGALAVLLVLGYGRRRFVRERLQAAARALGVRRFFEVCYRSEDSDDFGLWPWDRPGLLLAHRGQAVFVSERGEAWLGAGKLAWEGRRSGMPWFAVESKGGSHYFTAEPGPFPFGFERATRAVMNRLEEDLASPGKVRGTAL
ncbi:MAG: hypothetical protein HY925_16330 [Elusimicrobia bacterium]|nr:hypothetical protein [Elusimicrobiota bacterium]